MSETGEYSQSAVVCNYSNKPVPELSEQAAESEGTRKNNRGEGNSRPFLKKGTGLNRFYRGQPPKQYSKRKTKSLGEPSSDYEKISIIGKENSNRSNPLTGPQESFKSCGKDQEEDELEMFEALEKATGAASFCSTSSLAAHFLQTKFNLMRADKEGHLILEGNGESSSQLFSLPSSIFGSDEDDEEEEEGNEDEEQGEEEEDVDEEAEDQEIYIMDRSRRELSLPAASVSPRLPTDSNNTKDIELLRQENSSLKARILYLEEKTEKNTLEWWSHKEQMVQIVHSLQSTISRRDKQLESIQNSLTKKIENLEEDMRTRSQKWTESQINLVERIKLLEDELQVSHEQHTKSRNKAQKAIDTMYKELRDKTTEWVSTREYMENRITTLESDISQNNTLQPRKSVPTMSLSDHVKEPAETMEENIFGSDKDETEQCEIKILPNGDKETIYPNGTRKIVTGNLSEMKHFYTNGDIRVLKRDGTVKYLYAESGTWQTTYTNGVEYFEFANGQIERRNPNGVTEVVFTNGCVKYAHPSGREECIFADNTILRVDPNGERSVVLPNGQQEIYGSDYKKRIYPDGTVKTLYNDGTQETRYPNGRVRIKDREGVLLADITDSHKRSREKLT